jgi:hypothetical protein
MMLNCGWAPALAADRVKMSKKIKIKSRPTSLRAGAIGAFILYSGIEPTLLSYAVRTSAEQLF